MQFAQSGVRNSLLAKVALHPQQQIAGPQARRQRVPRRTELTGHRREENAEFAHRTHAGSYASRSWHAKRHIGVGANNQTTQSQRQTKQVKRIAEFLGVCAVFRGGN
jgi:hypothetical protein